jgi:hypothetical protein
VDRIIKKKLIISYFFFRHYGTDTKERIKLVSAIVNQWEWTDYEDWVRKNAIEPYKWAKFARAEGQVTSFTSTEARSKFSAVKRGRESSPAIFPTNISGTTTRRVL